MRFCVRSEKDILYLSVFVLNTKLIQRQDLSEETSGNR